MSLSADQQHFLEETASTLGLSTDEVYASAPEKAWSLRNQLWQGKPSSTRFPLGLAFVEDGQVDTAVSNARERLEQKANGFDAVVICQRDAAGRWLPSKILERAGGTIGWRLQQLVPEVELVHVAPPNTIVDPPSIGASTLRLIEVAVRQLRQTPNVILQGPPGTGKTYVALQIAKRMAGSIDLAALQLSSVLQSVNGNLVDLVAKPWFLNLPLVWELVQMHPGYAYDDFVRGRTLVTDGAGSRFESVDRIIPQLAAVAKARGNMPTLLVIDEINRCNLSNVLGELIFALDPDRRGEEIRLQYPPPPSAKPGEGVLLSPRNLSVLATMNTADRSIALVDFAIRRRFRFLDVLPDASIVAEYYAADKTASERAREALFQLASDLVAEERLKVGHSYFLCPLETKWPLRLANRIAYEVLPLLREYFAEGHLLGGSQSITLPDGSVIDATSGGADVGNTTARDAIRDYLAT